MMREEELKKQKNEQKKKEIPTVVETKEPKTTFKEKEVEKYISGTAKIQTFAEWKEWPGNKISPCLAYAEGSNL